MSKASANERRHCLSYKYRILFDRCHRSIASATPVTYEGESNVVTYTFEKPKIRNVFKEKWKVIIGHIGSWSSFKDNHLNQCLRIIVRTLTQYSTYIIFNIVSKNYIQETTHVILISNVTIILVQRPLILYVQIVNRAWLTETIEHHQYNTYSIILKRNEYLMSHINIISR